MNDRYMEYVRDCVGIVVIGAVLIFGLHSCVECTAPRCQPASQQAK